MKRIRVDDLKKDWLKSPQYCREYEALEVEFLADHCIDGSPFAPNPRNSRSRFAQDDARDSFEPQEPLSRQAPSDMLSV
jgi:hypothetical protein